MILAWCHPRPGKDMSVPVVSALCPSSRLWAGAGASADSGGHGVGRAGRKVTPKGEDTWGRHLAGCLRSRAAPGSRPDWLAQMCAQHPWAKMEDLQSRGSDGARELRVGVGPRARGNQAQDCACLCGERTRAQPLGCEARGAALPPDCSQGFDSLCLQTHLMPLSCCPAFLPDLPHRLHVMGGSSGSPTPVYRQCGDGWKEPALCDPPLCVRRLGGCSDTWGDVRPRAVSLEAAVSGSWPLWICVSTAT